MKRRGRGLLKLTAAENLDPARLVEAGCFKTRIFDRHGDATQFHADTEAVSFVRALPDGHHEFTGLITVSSVKAKHIPEVTMIPLIKRSRESDSGLD
jgi:hypothetical protein